MLAAWTPLLTLGNILLWNAFSCCCPERVRITRGLQAADSHSCRDQGKTRGGSARDSPLMIQSRGGPGIIPTFSNSWAAQSPARAQAPSLGNINWSQELLQPITLEMPQPETTPTTQQHNNTPQPKAGAPTTRAGNMDRDRKSKKNRRQGATEQATGAGRA